MPANIVSITGLPYSPFNGSDKVGIVITSGVPTFFKIVGINLDEIISVNWYPQDPGSVNFSVRPLILVDATQGTFMIKVTNNYLSDHDRKGVLSFQLTDMTTRSYPVETYGRLSAMPIWRAPSEGLITG
jgi:hypothetical protein